MARKPENKGAKFTPTPRVKRAIELFKAQITGKAPYKGVEHILLEAGYSPASAKQVTNVMEAIKPHVDDIVARMERHREAIMTTMEEKVGEAKYAELVRGLDVTTKSIRLLTGKSTANIAVATPERRAELEKLLED